MQWLVSNSYQKNLMHGHGLLKITAGETQSLDVTVDITNE
jgi:hypothetical protein